MRLDELKYFLLSFLLVVPIISGCDSTEKKRSDLSDSNNIEEKTINSVDSFSVGSDSVIEDNFTIDTLEVIVVQCANGYEYGMFNYDFNPVIETELNKFNNIKVKPFPLKTLMGVAYQGVFDKKYCPPIIEKVDVDFLILTRFDKKFDELNRTEMDWGYELKIVNAKTLKQVNSISVHNLKEYEQIEKHIKDNIGTLKTDIERLK